MTPQTKITRNDDVLFSEVADGMSLMDIESGNYFHYDRTAAAVWKAIGETNTLENICADLTGKFDVDPVTCEKDTAEFLKELAELGLIKTH